MTVLMISALIFSILSADILGRAETVYAEEITDDTASDESYDTETESDAIVEDDASASEEDSSDDMTDSAADTGSEETDTSDDAADAGSEETDAQTEETGSSDDTSDTDASDSGSTESTADAESTLIDISGASVTLGYTKKVYTGSALKPSVVVKYAGKKLTSGTDYSIKYKSNKSIGTAYVIVTGKGNYTGSVKKKFTIIPAQVKISSASWSDTSKLTVKWSKVSGSVTKYQIRYRKKGTSTWKTKNVSASSASVTLKSLSTSSRYQVQVRAYKTVSGKKYYGKWSSVKTVKSRYERTIKVNGSKKTLHHTAGTWTEKNGYKYYTIKSTGKKAKKTFLNIKGSIYYFDSNGRMLTGWHKIKGSYYFFNRTSGKMSSGKTVEKVKLTSYGPASTKAIYVKRIKVMIAAREMMEANTNATDSKSVKLKKCFKALFPYSYKRYRKLKPIYKEANWELTFANDIFVRGAGCCVSLASAFAYLARECGYTDIYIGHDTSHAWTVIDGYIYDPLFAEAKGMSGNYHSKSKSDYRMYVPYKREI